MDKRWNDLFILKGKSNLNFIKKQLDLLGFIKNFKIVNIVGTNGKGSCSKMIANTLEGQGHKVGLFTSPHLCLPNERISINGENILDQDFFDIFNKIEAKQFFSSLFIVAMKYFQIKGIDYAIIEAGVGGKMDSTNAIDGDYGLLTSVGIDHVEYLGNTHQKIFNDKIQIQNKEMIFFIPSYLPNDIVIPENMKMINNNSDEYQSRNELLVSGFMKECFNLELIDKTIPRGRTELWKYKGIECIFDVAHNIDGIKETLNYLKMNGIPFDEVVISLAKRKAETGIIELFGNKKIRYFKPDDTFKDFKFEEIQNIEEYIPQKKTLFIGSFKLIGTFYE